VRAPAQDALPYDLRLHLRAATMAAHDLLDHAMQAASGWQNLGDYARFLALQHAARAPVEAWLERRAPASLRPPPQTPLIARDLAALGEPLPPPSPDFAMTPCNRGEALGAAWVLAGSALGNRSILKQVRRASAAASPLIGAGEQAWPSAFLADGAMLAFWNDLRGQIERPAIPEEAAAASRAASAVFDHFIAHAQSHQP
jgi:heme oxygenase (biliverdin-IX-beta and delta-forming)